MHVKFGGKLATDPEIQVSWLSKHSISPTCPAPPCPCQPLSQAGYRPSDTGRLATMKKRKDHASRCFTHAMARLS